MVVDGLVLLLVVCFGNLVVLFCLVIDACIGCFCVCCFCWSYGVVVCFACWFNIVAFWGWFVLLCVVGG